MNPLIIDSFADDIEQSVEDGLETLVDLFPSLVVAGVVLFLAFSFAGTVARRVVDVFGSVELFDSFESTVAGSSTSDARGTAMTVLTNYVKLIGVVLAVAIVDIGRSGEFAITVGWYATFIIAALVVLLVGAVIAKAVGDRTAHWEPVEGTEAAPALSGIVQAFLYLVAAVIILDLLQLHTALIVLVIEQLAFGLGLAVAIGLGLAIGLGYKEEIVDYVDDVRE